MLSWRMYGELRPGGKFLNKELAESLVVAAQRSERRLERAAIVPAAACANGRLT